MKNFANVLSLIQKYMGAVIVGVHAAASVPGASNADKKTTVLDITVGVSDAIAQVSNNPEIAAVSTMIDFAAIIINQLTAKTAAATAPPAPVAA